MDPLLIDDLSGGRNGVDHPGSPGFPSTQSVEAINADLSQPGVIARRLGSVEVMGSTTNEGFTSPIATLIRHTPSGNENAAEVWAFEESLPGNQQALPAGATAWNATVSAYINWAAGSDVKGTEGCSFNGKLYLGYVSTGSTDRMKVYDPVTGKIRYTGMGTPAAPTVADTGSGSYTATIRYYRVRFYRSNVTNVYERVSEPSASQAFTPSGTGTHARITKPASLGGNEDENAWIIEASPDNTNWYILVGLPIGTTTYDDNTAVSAYANGTLTWVTGWFTQIPSAKYILTDGQRLIFLNFDQQGQGSRVGWTPVLGSGDADDERIFQTASVRPYITLGTKHGGDITGGGVINGILYVFKAQQVYRGVPTDDLYRPYVWRRISSTVGCIASKTICLMEDAYGNPALGFLSSQGPYRVTLEGRIEYLGRDVEDLTRTTTGAPNINTNAEVVAHAVFHAGRGQWWLWFAQGASTTPNVLLILNVKKATRRDEYGVRGGWARYTGNIATAYCSCLGHLTVGATSIHTRPWIARTDVNNELYICDVDTAFADNGTGYAAYVGTRSLLPFGRRIRVAEPSAIVWHTQAVSTALVCSVNWDYANSTPQSITLGSGEINTKLIRKFESTTVAGAAVLQLLLGQTDASSTDHWRILQVAVEVYDDGAL